MRTAHPAQPEMQAAKSKKVSATSLGDSRAKIQGKLDQTSGAAQDLYGQGADAAPQFATGFDKWLRTTIETQPYTAAAVALGIGWLLGRMHRPL